ncbi:MAG: nickel-type superoxide dismutase maturation protease [Chloroflexota bacterium]
MNHWPKVKESNLAEKLRLFLGLRRNFRVNGPSMLPTLRDGEQVLADLGAYKNEHPRVGEIVVAFHPDKPIKLIKRVAEVLKDGRYVLKGDNLAESNDSRDFGAISRDQILGRVTSKLI